MATRKPQVSTDKLAWRFEPPAKTVVYREVDVKYVGDEPVYPSLEEQQAWTDSEYRTQVMRTLNWYAHTQDKKKSAEWLSQFLARNPRRQKIADSVKRGDIWPGPTVGFALRAGRVGLALRFGTLRTLVKQLKQADTKDDEVEDVVPKKVEKDRLFVVIIFSLFINSLYS